MAAAAVIVAHNDEDDADGVLVDDVVVTRKKKKLFRYQRNPISFYQVILFGVIVLLIILTCVALETYLHTGHLLSGRPHSKEDAKYHKDIVDTVNSKRELWKAKYNRWAVRASSSNGHSVTAWSLVEKFADRPMHLYQNTDTHLKHLIKSKVHIPSQFDARTAWPRCWSVHQVSNQAGCGSCWAVAATSVMSDRVCVASNGTKQTQLSALDLTSCCKICGGCQGTHWALSAFSYWKEEGIVSGGAFGSHEGCRPYSFEPDCGSPCASSKYSKDRTPTCERSCRPDFDGGPYEEDISRARSAYWLRAEHGSSEFTPVKTLIENIVQKAAGNENVTEKYTELLQKELLVNGPVLACFTLYEDFQHYKSGIYSSEDGRSEQLYGHCAKLFGWGSEAGHRYWIYANTWGRDWGENGFFRIAFSELPEEVVAGIPV